MLDSALEFEIFWFIPLLQCHIPTLLYNFSTQINIGLSNCPNTQRKKINRETNFTCYEIKKDEEMPHHLCEEIHPHTDVSLLSAL